jgi:hypothetical protein
MSCASRQRLLLLQLPRHLPFLLLMMMMLQMDRQSLRQR